METTRCDTFARRLREARRARGLTQAEAAAGMGLASATLSTLERFGSLGTTRFVDVLAVCRYFDWPLDDVAALCFGPRAGTDAPAAGPDAGTTDATLLLRALPPEQRALVSAVVIALARGLVEEKGA